MMEKYKTVLFWGSITKHMASHLFSAVPTQLDRYVVALPPLASVQFGKL